MYRDYCRRLPRNKDIPSSSGAIISTPASTTSDDAFDVVLDRSEHEKPDEPASWMMLMVTGLPYAPAASMTSVPYRVDVVELALTVTVIEALSEPFVGETLSQLEPDRTLTVHAMASEPVFCTSSSYSPELAEA